jgi:hypothetical protein
MMRQTPCWLVCWTGCRLSGLHGAKPMSCCDCPGWIGSLSRHFGWRLVHGALRCNNAATVPWCKVASLQELEAEVCCSAAACGDIPQLESLSHVFM